MFKITIRVMESAVSEGQSRATTILLICREGESRLVYQEDLNFPGVLLVCVQMLMQFFRREVYCPLNGILVDMPTYMRCSEEEKHLLNELVAIFPALRIKCNESTREVRTLPFGSSYPGNTTPADFVQKHCSSVLPRKIRTCERSMKNLSVLLSATPPEGSSSGMRSVTANISPGGCFLICCEPWPVGDRGWLVIPELNDEAPVQVEVSWIRSWGEYLSLPGMGLRFIGLTTPQKTELSRLGGKSLMLEDQ